MADPQVGSSPESMGLASTCEDDPEHHAEYEREIRREAQELIAAGDNGR
jgi:hypothetical protein